METEFNAGRFDRAKIILQDHIEKEHQYHSDLRRLERALRGFEHYLNYMNNEWDGYIRNKDHFKYQMEAIKRAIIEMQIIMNKLVVEGKLELK